MKRYESASGMAMAVKACVECPNHKCSYTRVQKNGKWVSKILDVLCKRMPGVRVSAVGIDPKCTLPDMDEMDSNKTKDKEI